MFYCIMVVAFLGPSHGVFKRWVVPRMLGSQRSGRGGWDGEVWWMVMSTARFWELRVMFGWACEGCSSFRVGSAWIGLDVTRNHGHVVAFVVIVHE
jgi:hypothetical protein